MFQEFFFTWVPWVFNKATDLLQTSKSVYRVVYNELLVKKEWFFLQGNSIPISSETFGAIESGIKWRCSVNPPSFVQAGTLAKERHLSYLGFVVKVPSSGTVAGQDIDISEWVNEVKWQGTAEPSLKEIFILWCCQMGEPYFHCLDLIQVEFVTDMGDMVKKGLNE